MTDTPVIVITGTRKGIGRHLAAHYAARGWAVTGCSRGDADFSDPAYRHYALDVADERAVRAMLSETFARHGRIDALVNNAGIASMNHSLLTPLATIEAITRTNYFGTFVCCREAAKLMQRRRYGRIVNFATVATPLNLEGEAAYAASKAAVESLTRVLARELADSGITVNAVGPTPTDTDLIRGVPKDKMNALLARQAIRRFATMDDIANVVDFLIAPASSFVTGQVVYLGGV